jgi:hypothetical protein
MIKAKLLLFASVVFISFQAFSQTCQDDIDKSNKLYEEGAYKEAEELIKKTLETCDLDKTQENELLKLMASVYYELDELELADEYVARFIKKNPYYITSKKNDTYQFRLAVKKVKTWPRFTAGVKFGAPIGMATTKKIFPILDTANYLQDYLVKPNFSAALEIAWNINNYFSLNIGAGVRIQKITHQVPQYNNQLTFNYEEQTITSNVPLTLQFTLPINSNFVPVIFVGGEFEYFANASYTYYYSGSVDNSSSLSFYLNKKRENVTIEPENRNQYRYAALGGIRLLYKLERFAFFADARYIKEFSLYNNPDSHYNDIDLFLTNNYSLADIELETIDVSIGILYNFSYKVKSKY